jgi:hypothetical protein
MSGGLRLAGHGFVTRYEWQYLTHLISRFALRVLQVLLKRWAQARSRAYSPYVFFQTVFDPRTLQEVSALAYLQSAGS